MRETERLSSLFREAISGQPWHGPSLAAVLEGVDAAMASARPIDSAHSIGEIVLHLTGWTREVARRLDGGTPAPPAGGDWPALDEVEWTTARADLFSAHEDLLSALARFPDSRLDDVIGGERDAPLGTGVSYRDMILGALQHDAYHGAQIALVRKALLSAAR
jgi:hypothetical protein